MDVRRRNQLVRAFHTVLCCIPFLVFGWIIWQMEGRQRPVRTGIGLTVGAGFLVGLSLWSTLAFRRSGREMEQALQEAGIDPDALSGRLRKVTPEQPLRIIPRLPLAKDRDQLAAGILFVALLVFTFVAYYAGWIERMMGGPPER